MHDTGHQDPDVRVLELLDPGAAAEAGRKEREGVTRQLLEKRVVVSARDRHRGSAGKDVRPITEKNGAETLYEG